MALLLGACTGTGTGAPEAASEGRGGGVDLEAQVRGLPGGGLRVQYLVTNRGLDPVVVADGVPVADATRRPEPDPDAAYVRMRPGGTVEVSRRTFSAPAGSERSGTAVMRGTLLPAGEDLAGTVVLEAPVPLYQPYAAARGQAQVPESARTVVFCLGVVDPSDLEAALQTPVEPDDDRPVLRHPTRQLVLCSDEQPLPR
ncbi:hypothetical protein [Thalassiella azotivora]